MSAIELPAEILACLTEAAAERGMTADELAAAVIAARFGPPRRMLSFAGAGASESGPQRG
jgi:hypothetical protein